MSDDKPNIGGYRKHPVMEMFGPTIQGEGMLCGQVSHFIRFGGCTYRCTWCDSMHAVDPDQIKAHAKYLTDNQIMQAVHQLNPSPWVTLSGGDPCIHELQDLVVRLRHDGFKIAVETQGVMRRRWIQYCQAVTVSPKPPSSGMAGNLNSATLDWYVDNLEPIRHLGIPVLSFKVVVFDRVDLDWALLLHQRYPRVRFFLSIGTDRPEEAEGLILTTQGILDRFRTISSEVLANQEWRNVTILPQMHALLWGHTQGV